MAATKWYVFHHMVLIFYSFKDFSDLDLDMQGFQIWKTSGLEDGQTTSRKFSTRLPGSLPDDFQTTSRESSGGVFSHISLS
uniref:Uncharacterized protein n=1 Tax=Brassica oleracea var. oleracea TaxID=109376 RepID=A0A0D3CPJ3_BRAOL